MAELVFREASTDPWFKEGVTPGWLVINYGDGTGQSQRVVALADTDGEVVFEPTEEWQDVTITSGRE